MHDHTLVDDRRWMLCRRNGMPEKRSYKVIDHDQEQEASNDGDEKALSLRRRHRHIEDQETKDADDADDYPVKMRRDTTSKRHYLPPFASIACAWAATVW